MSPSHDQPGDDQGSRRQLYIALLAVGGIALHLILRFATDSDSLSQWQRIPLLTVLFCGGTPLVVDLLRQLVKLQFGCDILAAISIVTSVVLGEYLAGSLVVLMLSGGEALESYAVSSASSVLEALARRMPTIAHQRIEDTLHEVSASQLQVGDIVVVFPHEACPVDGVVVEGRGAMDESYLTGEPYLVSKTPGVEVISGAINGDTQLTIETTRVAADSRFAKIMEVMHQSQQERPQMRRLGDQLGAVYTPIAIAIAVIAWIASGSAQRFLAVLVVATPCPLLIGIPVAIIGAISLAARRAIIVRHPAALEKIDRCRNVVFDKTGTLTYGTPQLTHEHLADQLDADTLLALVASVDQYSKHPLATAIRDQAKRRNLVTTAADQIRERPGEGLIGSVGGRQVHIASRKQVLAESPHLAPKLPQEADGLECVILLDGDYAATYRFRDTPRPEGARFVQHLRPAHRVTRVVLLTGDRESEARYLAKEVGIDEILFEQSPEQKLQFIRARAAEADTLFVGDGINDAPALVAATVGVAFAQNSDVTTEAADVVVMDNSLAKIDELFHIGHRMRTIALQSAIGGMSLSAVGMLFAAAGYLPPVAGAIAQEVIDVLAVLNALRAAFPPPELTDYDRATESRAGATA